MVPPRSFPWIFPLALAFAFLAGAQQQPAQPKPEEKKSGPETVAKKKGPPAVLSFGLMAGGHLRDFLNTNGGAQVADTSGHLLIGPTLQVHWSRFTLELDALYRGYGTRSSGNLLGVSFENRAHGRAWEFPLLAKRRFYPNAAVKPILGAGIALRYLGQSSTLAASHDPGMASTNIERTYTFGIPLAAGVEFKANRFRFTPEFRYSIWAADNSLFPVRTQGLFDSNNNQFQLLLGFTF
jgi:opacity protein-like surface antigen